MKRLTFLIALCVPLLLVLLAVAPVALAAEPDGRSSGALMAFDEDVSVPPDQTTDFVLVIDGTATIAGEARTVVAIGGAAVSYTGAGQSGQPDNTDTSYALATSVTCDLTPVATDCWSVLFTKTNGGAASAGTGSTSRVSSVNGYALFDSNGTISGSTSMQATLGFSVAWAGIMASFAPASSGNPWYYYSQQ